MSPPTVTKMIAWSVGGGRVAFVGIAVGGGAFALPAGNRRHFVQLADGVAETFAQIANTGVVTAPIIGDEGADADKLMTHFLRYGRVER